MTGGYKNKSQSQLLEELEAVWREHYEADFNELDGAGISFAAMVQMFAGDDFYKLHREAQRYLLLSQKTELQRRLPKAENDQPIPRL